MPACPALPRGHIQSKLLNLLSSRGIARSDVAAAAAAVEELCEELETTIPWAEFNVADQIRAVLVDLLLTQPSPEASKVHASGCGGGLLGGVCVCSCMVNVVSWGVQADRQAGNAPRRDPRAVRGHGGEGERGSPCSGRQGVGLTLGLTL